MSIENIKPFEKEKLVVGLMYTNVHMYEYAKTILCHKFGDADSESAEYCFSDYSSFYNNEMNGTVYRRFLSFKSLIMPDVISSIKIWTNTLEESTKCNTGRTINIDPCLLSHGKFIMVTTKEASFRIPLQNNIYAELSLVYSRGAWHHFFWTYKDISSKDVLGYLEKVRKLYLSERNIHNCK